MNYMILFDVNGRKGETYPIDSLMTDEKKQELLEKGFVETAEDDWKYYVGINGSGKNKTGYVRDAETGKPVSAPPYVPSTDEQAQALYNACQADLRQIDAQIVNAVAIGDDKLVADLRQERAERIEQYQHDLAELEGGDE